MKLINVDGYARRQCSIDEHTRGNADSDVSEDRERR